MAGVTYFRIRSSRALFLDEEVTSLSSSVLSIVPVAFFSIRVMHWNAQTIVNKELSIYQGYSPPNRDDSTMMRKIEMLPPHTHLIVFATILGRNSRHTRPAEVYNAILLT